VLCQLQKQKTQEKIMNFTFSKERELIATEQALHLLRSEESSERISFAKNLIEQEDWKEFYVESTCSYGEITDGVWWLVHPSIAALEWQDIDFDPEKAGIDASFYYNLWH